MNICDGMTIKWFDEDGDKYCAHIQQDTAPDNPRADDDGKLTIMACWHSRYGLGDDIGRMNPEGFWQELTRKNVPECDVNEAAIAGKLSSFRVEECKGDPGFYDIYDTDGDLCYGGVAKDSIVYSILDELSINDCQSLMHPYAEWLPLWLYDHSGISMSCGIRRYPYSDRWDSGQVGYIVVLKDTLISELQMDSNSDDWRQTAIEVMETDVKLYDQYLTGDVYWYELYKFVDDGSEDGAWDFLESCGGFYGDDLMENDMLESVGYGFDESIKSNEYEEGRARHYSCVAF